MKGGFAGIPFEESDLDIPRIDNDETITKGITMITKEMHTFLLFFDVKIALFLESRQNKTADIVAVVNGKKYIQRVHGKNTRIVA